MDVMIIAQLAAAGLLAVAGAAAWMLKRRFVAGARRADGTLVRHALRLSAQGRPGYHAVVAFDVDGTRWEVVSRLGRNQQTPPVGTPVGVLYPVGAPAQAQLATTRELYQATLVLVIVSAVVLVCGLGMAVAVWAR